MLKPLGCRLFVLLSLLAGLYSVNGNVSKRGCLGDSIKIIETISYNSNDIVVSIYKNGDSKLILGMWHIQDGVPSIKNGQSDRVVLDKKGNIWILNLIISDEAKYTIKTDIQNSSKIYDVSLEIMAPPTKNCKPNIIHAGNNLFAELKTDECGRPPASAYWLAHPGISISRQVIELKPGKDSGIYHACIEGDSLICAKISNFSEHCSFYNKSDPKPLINQSVADCSTPRNLHASDNIPLASSESSTINIVICVMVALCLILLNVKRMKNLYQSWKRVPAPENGESSLCGSSLTNPPAVRHPSTSRGVIDVSGLSNLPAGRCTGAHGNGPQDTEMKTMSEEGETQPLIRHSVAGRSSPRRSIDTSMFEEEGCDNVGKVQLQDASPLEQERSETMCKHPVQGDSDQSIAQDVSGSFNTKMSIDFTDQCLLEKRSEPVGKYPVQGFTDPRAHDDEGCESAGKYPTQGAAPKPTGTRPKSITPLPPEKH